MSPFNKKRPFGLKIRRNGIRKVETLACRNLPPPHSQEKPDALATSFSRPGEQLIFLERVPQWTSKQLGRLALGPLSQGGVGEVSAKSLAPRASSITEQGAQRGRGRKGRDNEKEWEEEDGRNICQRESKG